MKKRRLGIKELEVSALGLGWRRMSFGGDLIGTPEEMISFLNEAVDHGKLDKENNHYAIP